MQDRRHVSKYGNDISLVTKYNRWLIDHHWSFVSTV